MDENELKQISNIINMLKELISLYKENKDALLRFCIAMAEYKKDNKELLDALSKIF